MIISSVELARERPICLLLLLLELESVTETPQCGTRRCIHATRSAWGGMGFFPQGTSQNVHPCAESGQLWLRRMELNTTEIFGVCTAARFGTMAQLPEIPWTTPFPLRYPAGQLEATLKGLTQRTDPMPPEDQLRQSNFLLF